MGKCISWIVLGVVFGGFTGFMGGLIPLVLGCSSDVARLSQALGVLLGGGFGAVTGAIVGGTNTLLDVMNDFIRRSGTSG